MQRLWRATLRPDDPEYARYHLPFASAEKAKDWVAVARKLLTIDPLPAPLHNGMIIMKSIGTRTELVASFGAVRVFAKLPLLA